MVGGIWGRANLFESLSSRWVLNAFWYVWQLGRERLQILTNCLLLNHRIYIVDWHLDLNIGCVYTGCFFFFFYIWYRLDACGNMKIYRLLFKCGTISRHLINVNVIASFIETEYIHWKKGVEEVFTQKWLVNFRIC